MTGLNNVYIYPKSSVDKEETISPPQAKPQPKPKPIEVPNAPKKVDDSSKKVFGFDIETDLVIVYNHCEKELLDVFKNQINEVFRTYGIETVYVTFLSTGDRQKRYQLADRFDKDPTYDMSKMKFAYTNMSFYKNAYDSFGSTAIDIIDQLLKSQSPINSDMKSNYEALIAIWNDACRK